MRLLNLQRTYDYDNNNYLYVYFHPQDQSHPLHSLSHVCWQFSSTTSPVVTSDPTGDQNHKLFYPYHCS